MSARHAAGLAAAVLALIAAAPAASASPAHESFSGVVLTSFEAQLARDINNARVQNGLAPLAIGGGTTEVARAWSAELASTDTLSHNPNLPADLSSHGSGDWTYIEENVGSGPGGEADTLFQAYMASPPHRANILSPDVSYLGVGAVETTVDGSPTEFNTLDFVDSYHGALARTTAAPPTAAPSSSARNVSNALRGARFSAVTSGRTSAARPHAARDGVAFTARSAGTGSAALVVSRRLADTRHAVSLHLSAATEGGDSLPVTLFAGSGRGLVRLGEVTLHPSAAWVTLSLPDSVSTLRHLVVFVSGRALSQAGGTATVRLTGMTA